MNMFKSLSDLTGATNGMNQIGGNLEMEKRKSLVSLRKCIYLSLCYTCSNLFSVTIYDEGSV